MADTWISFINLGNFTPHEISKYGQMLICQNSKKIFSRDKPF